MNRDLTRKISDLIDLWIPPIIRERRWFYGTLLRLVVKGDVAAYLDFRDNVWKMSDEQVKDFYDSIMSNIKRPTDCNEQTVIKILDTLNEHDVQNVLEFGCGRGYIAEKILTKVGCSYTGIDFNVSNASERLLNTEAILHNGVDLSPVADEKFCCVITTHTLEHVIDLRKIMQELWNKTQGILIVVVPLQLNHKYTADLHTRYWRRPGDFFISAGITPKMNPVYEIIYGDLFVCLSKDESNN